MKVLVTLIVCLCAAMATAHRSPINPNQPDAFDTMDDYSLLGILERVDRIDDLIVVASMSPRIRQLILDYDLIPGIRNIINSTISVQLNGGNAASGLWYEPAGKTYLVGLCTEHNCMLAALKAFCPLFAKLSLKMDYFYPHGDFPTTLVDCLNRYCSTVAQDIEIAWIRSPVHEFTAQHAASAKIDVLGNLSDFSIASHFPQLQELTIEHYNYFTTTEHLPHLRHLELADNSCGHFNFRAFAEKNPQITSAKLVLCEGLDFLQEVNELLPNLVSLHYSPRKDINHIMPQRGEDVVQSVRFRHVKKYTIELDKYFYNFRWQGNESYWAECFARLSRVQFDQLETLEFIAGIHFYRHGQLDFVGQYKHVKSLDYNSYYLTYGEVWYLVDLLPNLRQITFLPCRNLTEHGEFLRLMNETRLETIRATIDDSLVEKFRAFVLPEPWALHVDKSEHAYGKLMTFSR